MIFNETEADVRKRSGSLTDEWVVGVLGKEPRHCVVGCEVVVIGDFRHSFRSAVVVVDQERGVVVN